MSTHAHSHTRNWPVRPTYINCPFYWATTSSGQRRTTTKINARAHHTTNESGFSFAHSHLGTLASHLWLPHNCAAIWINKYLNLSTTSTRADAHRTLIRMLLCIVCAHHEPHSLAALWQQDMPQQRDVEARSRLVWIEINRRQKVE